MADTTPMWMVWDGNGRFWVGGKATGGTVDWEVGSSKAMIFMARSRAEEVAEEVGGHVISKPEAEAADKPTSPKVVKEPAKIDDGGFAFARPTSETHGQTGMFLRDYFAGQALAGYLAAHAADGQIFPDPDACAKDCYEYADAMIARRNRKG